MCVSVIQEPPGEAEVTEEAAVESWWVPAPAERRRNVTLVSGAAVLPSLGCSHS